MMERFSNWSTAYPHAYTQAEIRSMSDEDLAEAIRAAAEWDADLLTDLVWRAFPDYDEEWEAGDKICFDAAETLGVSID